MKKILIIIALFFSLSLFGFAQVTDQVSDEELYKQAEQAITFYNDGNYILACKTLKTVAESGQLDKQSLGIISYYLCDSYYQIADSLENGTLEKYEAMKECYRWMLQIDWKVFDDISPTDVYTNVISTYVAAIHCFSTTVTDVDNAIQLELEAMNLYNGLSKSDLNLGVIKAHLHELYMEKRQWDDAIIMAKDAEKIVFDNDGKIGDLVRIYSNLAVIYNLKNEIQTSGLYANRVLTCMKELNEDDLNYFERISYSMALYYLGINYQQVAKPVYYDYFKRAYYLIKSNDDIRHERYFRELLLQLVHTSNSLNDREFTMKFLNELIVLCEKYENPLGRIYNEVMACNLEILAEDGARNDVMQMFIDYISKWSEHEILINTEVCDLEEWSQEDRLSTYLSVVLTFLYEYSDRLLAVIPEQLRTLQSEIKGFGEENKMVCRILSYLSYIQGDYISCMLYGHKALENDVMNMDGDMFLLQMMANSARCQKRYDVLAIYNRSLFFDDKVLLKRNFLNLTSQVRSNYWAQAESNFQVIISNALVCNTQNSYELAYDATLCRKGILLSTDIRLAKIVTESRDTCLQRMYADLQMIHAARNELALKGDDRVAQFLATEADKLEGDVIHRAQEYKNFDKLFDFGWKDVSRRLSSQEAAVEFEMYIDEDDNLRYVALVLAKGHVHKVDLFTDEELQVLTKGDMYGNAALASRLWSPIFSVATGVKKVYFAPCGLLYNIAIESLPADNGFVADGVAFIRLSSTRELLQTGKNKRNAKDAVLYGGLQYDMDIDEMVAMADAASRQRGSLATITLLPGTLHEVRTIATTLKESKLEPIVLVKNAGTEQSVKALSGNKLRVMHIATHGFYNDVVPEEQTALAGLSTIQRGINEEDLALTRSGLLFAGADNRFQGEEFPLGVDDGILTAQEISTMNLTGVELITLSACETGLGDITGDGVFGLQRGFKKAGANSILMSLWKVDDEATCKLMTEFYSNWIGQKMTKHDALEAAKKTVRETKGWEDPKYWAAFILLDGLD